jgi:hypothetical protein
MMPEQHPHRISRGHVSDGTIVYTRHAPVAHVQKRAGVDGSSKHCLVPATAFGNISSAWLPPLRAITDGHVVAFAL